MKKVLFFLVAMLLFSSTASAGGTISGDIVLRRSGVCKGGDDVGLKLKYSLPGFVSWGSTDRAEGWGANPILVQFGQIQAISLELIKEGEGGFLDFIPLERGREWWLSECGHLVIKTRVCVPAGTVFQLLVNGIFGRQYQMAVDEAFGFFGFGRGCGFSQLNDGSWGITCGR